jgi:hypothetical protein
MPKLIKQCLHLQVLKGAVMKNSHPHAVGKMHHGIILIFFCGAIAALAIPAEAWDAAGDFSSVTNPNGVWSYGWSLTLGSPFILYTSNTTSFSGTGLSGWLAPATFPLILKNETTQVIVGNGTTTYQPGQLAEHPGIGSYSVVRWTAPYAGVFTLAATFSGLSVVGDSVDVHILNSGVSIFNSTVIGSPNPTSYSGSQTLALGDTIDFVVGWGPNFSIIEDTTGLSATIIPEPASVSLVIAAIGCLMCFRKRI